MGAVGAAVALIWRSTNIAADIYERITWLEFNHGRNVKATES